MIMIGLFVLCAFEVVCQVPEIPKFKPVLVKNFKGAPAKEKPDITSNISFWIPPNAELTAVEIIQDFIKVIYEGKTSYVFFDNFKTNAEVQEQLNSISKAEEDKKAYFEMIKELEKKYKDSVRLAEGIEVMRQAENEATTYAKKLFTKYSSLGSPLALAEASVTYNSIGIPEANLSAYNISKNDIDAFEVSILCYDNYNRPVNHYLHRTNVYKGISQDLVEPSNETFGTWTLYGYENTTKVTFVLKSVHYKSKGAWYPKNKILIKSE